MEAANNTAQTQQSIPQHVAIIMDGNGRWAQRRNQNRSAGHIEGVKRVHDVVDAASRMGIKYVTLYAFSTENWQRPTQEVEQLMQLFAESIVVYIKELHEKGVRLLAMGDLSRLPEATYQRFQEALQLTANNNTITMVIAVSYSSHLELNRAALALSQAIANKEESHTLTAYDNPLQRYLYLPQIPNPDLLIRTGGDMRLSNFMLYQAAYAELYFTNTLWPDFDEKALQEAVDEYALRERRYGKVSEQLSASSSSSPQQS